MTTIRFRPILAAAALAAFLTTLPAASAQPQPEGPRYVKSESVNVRGGPGTGNTVLEVLMLGTEVRIYATHGNWSRISPPDKPEKWIYSPLLQRDKPPAPAKAKTGDKHPDRKDIPAAQPQKTGQKAPSAKPSQPPDPADRKDKPDQPH